MTAPSFDDIFAVMSAASIGDTAARVSVPPDPPLDDTATTFAIALNVLLDDLAKRVAAERREFEAAREAGAAMEQMRREHVADATFRSLLEGAPDAMVVVDTKGTIVFVNGRVEAMFGYLPADLVGRPVEVLVPERLHDAHAQERGAYCRRPQVRLMGKGLDLRGRRKDGSEFPVEVSLSPLETEGGLLVSSAIRDVTERRAAEEQRALLAALVDASDDAIIGKTAQGVVTSWNRGAERLFGYDAREMVGRPIALLIPPGREHEEQAILEGVARGETQRFDTVRRRRDGIDVDVSVTSSPLRDAAGTVVGVAKVARDITDRKRAEVALAKAKEVAEGASRELEAFSYSVAHDLRAPLRGMNGFAQVLLDRYKDALDVEGQDWLNEIVLNAKRMGALIDALLALARVTRSDLKVEHVDLSGLVREAAAMLRSSDPERTTGVDVQEGLFADLDVRLARALVQNLVGNAWKFTSKTPAGRVEFGRIDEKGVPVFFVRDNGAGFDMAFTSKLFVPFQRLHSGTEFPGTGIGLATVQRIVRRHGGRVWAEGVPDAGATFYFTVPTRGSGGTP
jgi:PAS domain S-box-containing protein